jgi:aminoglycoside 3-N-acetyltransferase
MTMSERLVIQKTKMPLTKAKLIEEFRLLGLQPSDTILVHTSLSKFGYIIGGALAVIQALQEVVCDGTIIMPTQTGDNSNPEEWKNPPVSTSWFSLIKEHIPAYDPASSPTRGMGRVPELFRTLPGVVRSNHPNDSFAVWGTNKEAIAQAQPLTPAFGDKSPLGYLVNHNGKVLLLGVGYDSCTLMHYAEALLEPVPKEEHQCAVMTNGQRQWITYTDATVNTMDFNEIGTAFETEQSVHIRTIGLASVRVIDANALHQFTYSYMKQRR